MAAMHGYIYNANVALFECGRNGKLYANTVTMNRYRTVIGDVKHYTKNSRCLGEFSGIMETFCVTKYWFKLCGTFYHLSFPQ